jgi:hypothetical protein
MARKDLTALAALGTLGYMLSKKGDKKKDADKPNVYDVEDARKVEAVSEEDPEEAANKRVERTLVNPNAKEFGDAGTSETVTPTKKPATKPAVKPTTKPMDPKVMARSLAVAGERAMGSDSYTPQRDTKVDRRGEFDMSKYKPRRVYENTETSDMTYKKGGKVKKMASGGMTASKRADGIATKGKTKCKMY